MQPRIVVPGVKAATSTGADAVSPWRKVARASSIKARRVAAEEESTVEQSVMRGLSQCASAASLKDARAAIDELFDLHPYDPSILPLLARELTVNLLSKKSLVPSSPTRRSVRPKQSPKNDTLQSLTVEDEDDDEDQSPPKMRPSASIMSVRLQQQQQQQQQNPSSPPRAKYNSSTTSGSDVPSQSSEESSVEGASADEAPDDYDNGEGNAQLAEQWKEMLRYMSSKSAVGLGGEEDDENDEDEDGDGEDTSPALGSSLTYDEVARGWKLDERTALPSSQSPGKLLSYSGLLSPSARPYPSYGDLNGDSEFNDSIDSESSDGGGLGGYAGHYPLPEHGDKLPPAAVPPPPPAQRDTTGSLQYLKENLVFSDENLDALLRNVAKYSMRDETERLFTKILGPGYMDKASKGKSGFFPKQEKEELGGSPPEASRDDKWVLPQWGKGRRFASPVNKQQQQQQQQQQQRERDTSYIYPLHYSSSTAPTSAVKAVAPQQQPLRFSSSINKPASTRPKPVRYYLSVPSTPTYKTASNARATASRRAGASHHAPPSYKYPKPTPPQPPAAPIVDSETARELAEKAGLGKEYPRFGGQRGGQRRRTLINMRYASMTAGLLGASEPLPRDGIKTSRTRRKKRTGASH
jgi:hypothetical protein